MTSIPASVALWVALVAAPWMLVLLGLARTTRQRRAGAICAAILGTYIALQVLGFHVQRSVDGLSGLAWPWLGKLICAALVVGVASRGAGMTPGELGLSRPVGVVRLRPVAIVLLLCCGVSLVDFMLGERMPRTVETVLFQAMMPGLDEELLLRGVIAAILDDAWSRRRVLFGAQVGPSLPITTAMFVWAHMVAVDPSLRVELMLVPGTLLTLTALGALLGWLRARTGDVWLCVLGHNLANSALVTLSWMFPGAPAQ